ncbi:MAG: hypothetical protein WAW79_01155 [Steroidobacteraceae bacterium]
MKTAFSMLACGFLLSVSSGACAEGEPSARKEELVCRNVEFGPDGKPTTMLCQPFRSASADSGATTTTLVDRESLICERVDADEGDAPDLMVCRPTGSGPAGPEEIRVATAAAVEDPLVCKKVEATGSRIRKGKVCKPKSEWDGYERRAEDMLKKIERDNSTNVPDPILPPGGG